MVDVTETAPVTSARRDELLERAYDLVHEHGLAGMSLRPLARAIGSSPRVLLFLFESKDGLVRALLARARADESELLRGIRDAGEGDLAATGRAVWRWLADPDHRGLLRLGLESYAQSLVAPDGPWAGFAAATVEDWLALLATAQPPAERDTAAGEARRTLMLAVLRGGLLDLLATGDAGRVTGAVQRGLVRIETRA